MRKKAVELWCFIQSLYCMLNLRKQVLGRCSWINVGKSNEEESNCVDGLDEDTAWKTDMWNIQKEREE
jgi:hypothetical protein